MNIQNEQVNNSFVSTYFGFLNRKNRLIQLIIGVVCCIFSIAFSVGFSYFGEDYNGVLSMFISFPLMFVGLMLIILYFVGMLKAADIVKFLIFIIMIIIALIISFLLLVFIAGSSSNVQYELDTELLEYELGDYTIVREEIRDYDAIGFESRSENRVTIVGFNDTYNNYIELEIDDAYDEGKLDKKDAIDRINKVQFINNVINTSYLKVNTQNYDIEFAKGILKEKMSIYVFVNNDNNEYGDYVLSNYDLNKLDYDVDVSIFTTPKYDGYRGNYSIPIFDEPTKKDIKEEIDKMVLEMQDRLSYNVDVEIEVELNDIRYELEMYNNDVYWIIED